MRHGIDAYIALERGVGVFCWHACLLHLYKIPSKTVVYGFLHVVTTSAKRGQ
jgi:hypothetical protein